MDALRAAVRHRRGLVADRKVAQQRLHDQLNALCPGLSAPAGHGRSLAIETPDRAGGAGVRGRVRRPGADSRSLTGPGTGAADEPTAATGSSGGAAACHRRRCRATRARRLGRDLDRYRTLQADIAAARGRDRDAAGGHRRSDPDHPARGRGHPCRGVRGVTACRSTGSPMPSISTRPPAWPPRSTSRRPCTVAAGSPARAWPSTATR